MEMPHKYLSGMKRMHQWITKCFNLAKSKSRYTSSELLDNFWPALICDAALDYSRPGLEYFESYLAWYASFQDTASIISRGYWISDFVHWYPIQKATDFIFAVQFVYTFARFVPLLPLATWFHWLYMVLLALLGIVIGKFFYGDGLRGLVVLVTQWLLPSRSKLADRIQSAAQKSSLYTEAFNTFSSGRRFCVTENGYIGWVHKSARVGDKIVLFRASRIPFTLRQVGSVYILIGDCFLQGAMNHEVFESEAIEDEEIVII